jgi:hypothetical protein
MTPIVCILSEADARLFTGADIAYRCSSRLHHHFKRREVVALVKAGELIWLGKHKNVATYRNARSWVKVYTYNEYGEVIACGMQLVPDGGF